MSRTHLLVQGGGHGEAGLLAGHQGGATVAVPPYVLGRRGQAVGRGGGGTSSLQNWREGGLIFRFLILQEKHEVNMNEIKDKFIYLMNAKKV